MYKVVDVHESQTKIVEWVFGVRAKLEDVLEYVQNDPLVRLDGDHEICLPCGTRSSMRTPSGTMEFHTMFQHRVKCAAYQ